MVRPLAVVLLVTSTALAAAPLQAQTLTLAPDSPRWLLEGKAEPATFLGRPCLLLDGGGATVKDFQMRDGVVDIATPATRGFFGTGVY